MGATLSTNLMSIRTEIGRTREVSDIINAERADLISTKHTSISKSHIK